MATKTAKSKPRAKAKPKEDKCTPVEERFVKAYLVNLNAQEAARRVGLKAPQATAYRMLARPRVVRLVERLKKAQLAKFEFDADDVVRELAKLGFSNMADYWQRDPDTGEVMLNGAGGPMLDFKKLTPAQTAALTEVSYDANLMPRIKLGSKVAALEALCKRFGLFLERLEHTFPEDEEEPEDLGKLTPHEAAARWDQMVKNA